MLLLYSLPQSKYTVCLSKAPIFGILDMSISAISRNSIMRPAFLCPVYLDLQAESVFEEDSPGKGPQIMPALKKSVQPGSTSTHFQTYCLFSCHHFHCPIVHSQDWLSCMPPYLFLIAFFTSLCCFEGAYSLTQDRDGCTVLHCWETVRK